MGNVTESQGDLEQQGFKPRQREIVGNYSKLANSPPPSLSQRPLSCVLFQLLVSLALAGPGWPWIRTSDLRADHLPLEIKSYGSTSPCPPCQQLPSGLDSAWMSACRHIWPPHQCQGIVYIFLRVSHLVSQTFNMYGAGQFF